MEAGPAGRVRPWAGAFVMFVTRWIGCIMLVSSVQLYQRYQGRAAATVDGGGVLVGRPRLVVFLKREARRIGHGAYARGWNACTWLSFVLFLAAVWW